MSLWGSTTGELEGGRQRWDTIMSGKFFFRQRWWSKASRDGPPDFYEVCLGSKANAVHLGTIYRRRACWKASLAVPTPMSSEEQIVPAQLKAYEARHRTELGIFPTRTAAARSLKEESLDRGWLRNIAPRMLGAVDALALIGVAA